MKIVYSKHQSLQELKLPETLLVKKVVPRKRLIINKGNYYYILRIKEVAFFQRIDNRLMAVDFNQKQHFIDLKMKSLESELEQDTFFRVNRQFIININSIARFEPYFNGRLIVKTNPKSEERILISRKNVNSFKIWIDS